MYLHSLPQTYRWADGRNGQNGSVRPAEGLIYRIDIYILDREQKNNWRALKKLHLPSFSPSLPIDPPSLPPLASTTITSMDNAPKADPQPPPLPVLGLAYIAEVTFLRITAHVFTNIAFGWWGPLCVLPCLGLGLWLTLTVYFDLA